MSDYYWDDQIEYLRNTRWLYYNDDYLEFLVQRVWKIGNPVDVIDYGCGYGYLGLKLLPLLPEGSTYTGLDKSKELIKQAKEIFSKTSYQTTFIVDDIETVKVKRQYDVAISHAFLLHMKEPITVLQKMIESIVDEGRVICFEPHWIANMSNYELHGLEQSKIIQLGILQKLFEEDSKRSGKDGNIGMKIPILLSQLGLRNVECRVSDKVNFLDQHMADSDKKMLFHALKEEGLGQEPNARHEIVNQLVERGLNSEEANRQYEAESVFAKQFNENSWLTYAPNMKITSGIVTR
ncbi:class I SAM-dependent methyltransferase [Paenibacillus sp. 1781tsa1]|uniref:class I SAM-dependent methyltransferase n=1 Tax=Paenibacillus sp. 1781tsa1 TaxID=2953810 RepID=UPI00209FE5AF|nr:class I SAM-dependent methyltransferase [Paenibacillus sp. 1781tsa1]MCP1183755.1 class I SAM-dependent methyltransferase [Paenibacillus sp. 1781tsa1]